jgi:hypothetical protein
MKSLSRIALHIFYIYYTLSYMECYYYRYRYCIMSHMFNQPPPPPPPPYHYTPQEIHTLTEI